MEDKFTVRQLLRIAKSNPKNKKIVTDETLIAEKKLEIFEIAKYCVQWQAFWPVILTSKKGKAIHPLDNVAFESHPIAIDKLLTHKTRIEVRASGEVKEQILRAFDLYRLAYNGRPLFGPVLKHLPKRKGNESGRLQGMPTFHPYYKFGTGFRVSESNVWSSPDYWKKGFICNTSLPLDTKFKSLRDIVEQMRSYKIKPPRLTRNDPPQAFEFSFVQSGPFFYEPGGHNTSYLYIHACGRNLKRIYRLAGLI